MTRTQTSPPSVVLGWIGVLASLGALSAGCSLVIDSSKYRGDGGIGEGGNATVPADAPSTPVIELSPTGPRTTDDLVVTITTPSTDPLGGAVEYEYRWLRDDAEVEGETGATLAAALTRKGQTWRVEVTPVASPGERRGLPAIAEVTIANTPPVLTTVALDHYIVAVGETVQATRGPTIDPDGDSTSMRLRWLRNGEVIEGATTTTIHTADFAAGDRIELEAWVTDGTDESEFVRVGPITLDPAVTRWRPLAPSALDVEEANNVAYDEPHRRWVSYRDGLLWERWVSRDGLHIAAIPVSGTSPPSGAAIAFHDIEGRRLLYRTTADPATLYVLDLSTRGGESWSALVPSGVAPDIRVGVATYYDRETRTLWGFGGLDPSAEIPVTDQLWSLVLTPGSETWRTHSVEGERPGPTFGAALARDPSRSDVLYLFGGVVDGAEDTPLSTSIYRLTTSSDVVQSELRAESLPSPVFGSAATTTDRAILVVGGASDIDDLHVDVGAVRYDPTTGELERIASSVPDGFFGLLVADPDDSARLLFWRGLVDDETALDGTGTGLEIRALDPRTGTLTDVAIERRPPGLSEASVSLGDTSNIIVLGGRTSEAVPSPIAWVYSKTSDQWTVRTLRADPETMASPAARWGVRAFDTTPYSTPQLFGGLVAPNVLADSEVWELAGTQWLHRSLAEGRSPLLARTGAAFVASGSCGYHRNYVFGGERPDTTLLGDTTSLACPHEEPRTCAWTTLTTSGPSPRTLATLGVDSTSHMWLVGGRSAVGPTGELHVLNACEGSPVWRFVTPTSGPSMPARYAHSMSRVPGGEQPESFLVYGGTVGENDSDLLGDVWRLTVVSSSMAQWTEIVPGTTLRPQPRAYHQTFWDSARSRLVMFGGRRGTTTLSDAWELIVVP